MGVRKALNTDTCPDGLRLDAYAAGRLAGKRNEEVFLHLRRCSACLRRIAELRRVPSPDEIIRPARERCWRRCWARLAGVFRGRRGR